MAAVLAAVAAFRSEERIRRSEAQDEAREQEETQKRYAEEASRVSISCSANHEYSGEVVAYDHLVHNGTDATILYELRGKDPSGPLEAPRELAPGLTSRTPRRVGTWKAPAGISKRDLERWVADGTEITFRMNGQHWRRIGGKSVERVEAGTPTP